ncbi:MAG TPA: hemolysin family protein, partial [Nitrososphaera sp.]
MLDLYIALPLLGGLVALSGFFSGMEVALISISKGQLRRIVNEGKKGSKSVEKLKSNPSRMLVTLLLGNNLVNVGAAAVATDLTISIFGSVGLGIATGVMTMVLLIFGEITPKAYCNIHAEPIALRFSRVILGMQYALYPIVRALEGATKGIFQITGSDGTPKPISEEEVRAVIDVGVEEKALQKSEQEMMEDVMEFHDTKVRAIMTPRNKMFSLDARMLLWDALPLINEIGYSRIPIMEETTDNIVGIVHTRDVLKAVETKTSYMMLKDVARKPLFVSMEMGINKLMKEFQGRHIHMAVVVDEHGSTQGLVTLEDIIEELVGEIADETDFEAQQIKKLD